MKRKPVRIAAYGAIVLALVGGVTIYNVARDDITVSVDGVNTQVRTHASDVATILQAAGVSVDSNDLVSPALNGPVGDSGKITVRHARDLRLNIDGQNITKVTTADTLGDAITQLKLRSQPATFSLPDDTKIPTSGLNVNVSASKQVKIYADGKLQTITTDAPSVELAIKAANITLSGNDVVSSPLSSGMVPGQLLTVTRVKQVQATSAEPVAFTTIQQSDTSKFVDDTAVVTKGKPGVLTTTYTSVQVDGMTISRGVLSQNITTTPVQQIERKGTRIKPSLLAPGQVVAGTNTTEPLPGASLAADGSGTAVTAPDANSVVTDPQAAKAFAKQLMASQYSWGDSEFSCLEKLWTRESDWNYQAKNPSSAAYGIPQSLPGTKMASAGADWQTNGATQIRWGLDYIKGRYQVPCNAWAHSESVNWY